MNKHILHFSIGPVQGFVADARRTRDLWAGSFLLSWLSEQAMWAVQKQPGCKVLFPEVAGDDLFEAVWEHREKSGTDRAPYIGSVPNRFKASVAESFNPDECAQAVRAAWEGLAKAVWDHFVKDVAGSGKGTVAIWKRQIANFWEIAWVKGPDPKDRTDGAWLDRRKNWRTHYPEYVAPSSGGTTYARYEEGGDHCQLMGFYQELSGYVRAKGEGPLQKTFWDALQGKTGVLNLRENERLCAIALVKRLFPLLPGNNLKSTIGWVPGANEKDKKESLDIEHWPSVSYIAAVPWLEHVWTFGEAEGEPNACEKYKKEIDNLTKSGIFGETATNILGLGFEDEFFKLDGHFYHVDAVRSMELARFQSKEKEQRAKEREQEAKRKDAVKALEKLQADLRDAFEKRQKQWREKDAQKKDEKPARYPPLAASEFYAVLRADGDKIGENLRGENGVDEAKQGLAAFTREVPRIIKEYHGVTNYAGGDDVLALLPLDYAIPAAIKLRIAYAEAFQSTVKNKPPEKNKWTLSAAIVFAQYKIPFRAVLKEAHRQLDEVAKDKNGRDSLALAVMKPGGVVFSWASAWSKGSIPSDKNKHEEWGAASIPGQLSQMAKELHADRDFTTGFFYNIRERYQPLFDTDEGEGKVPLVDKDQFQKFLEAEFRKSEGKKEQQAALIGKLMTIGYPLTRENGETKPTNRFSFDAALLMRFLAEEGRWFMGGNHGK